LIPAHLDTAWRLARTLKVPVAAVPTAAAGWLRFILDGTGQVATPTAVAR